MIRSLIAVLALATFASPAHAASGGLPFVLPHHGRLLDGLDKPVSAALSMTFRIYDADAGVSGTLEWQATCGGVQVVAGFYVVELGGAGCTGSAENGLDPVLDTSDVPLAKGRWLEVEIAGTKLAPRMRIGTVPTAAVASRALDSDALGGEPATAYAKAKHTHAAGEITGLAAAVTAAGVPWDSVLDKPTSFPAKAHGHAAAEVTGLAPIATSGAYGELAGLPDLKPVATTGAYNDLTGRPSLKPVATTGAYDDLTGRPALSALALTGAFADLTGHPIGTLTDSKWCRVVSGKIQCTADAPSSQASANAPSPVACSTATTGTLWYDASGPSVRVCNGVAYVVLGAVPPPPGPPTSVTVLTSNLTLTVSWPAVAGAGSYEVGYSVGSTLASSPTLVSVTSGTSTAITGLVNGTQYAVAVRSVVGTYTSGWSTVVLGRPALVTVDATFTSCGVTGQTGPSQGQCDSSYLGTELASKVSVTGGIQSWTVPASATYRIEAWGARAALNQGNLAGANGARMRGDFTLTQGQVLKILVGQIGSRSPSANSSSGGGGTFVVLADNSPVIIAGGGGGRGGGGAQPGVGGATTNCGTVDDLGFGVAACNGQGGTTGTASNGNGGGGGGGLLTNATPKLSNSGYPGFAFVNGGAGGSSRDAGSYGGFGGGGGNHETSGGGGGGGGYSGGIGGQSNGSYGGGGGGGSWNNGANADNAAAFWAADGKVRITSL